MAKRFLGKLTDVPPGRAKTFLASGKKIFVINQGGELKAYVNFCPHMGGSLRFDGKQIVCNWHSSRFDPGTGAARTAPAAEGSSLNAVKVFVEGDDIYYEEESVKSPWAGDF